MDEIASLRSVRRRISLDSAAAGAWGRWRLCDAGEVRRLLSRLFGERSGEVITRSGSAELRVGEERANLLLGDLNAGIQHGGAEPAPVEAVDAAWRREGEQRERDERSQPRQ